MDNAIKLENLADLNPAYIATLALEELHMLQDELDGVKQTVKVYQTKINDSLRIKLDVYEALAREEKQKQTGQVSVPIDGFKVTFDTPKKVEWNQAKLRGIYDMIVKDWGRDPTEYMKVELSVSETSYNAWPQEIRDVFMPARTVSHGTKTIKMEPKK